MSNTTINSNYLDPNKLSKNSGSSIQVVSTKATQLFSFIQANLSFIACLATIVGVSIYDTYMVVVFQDLIVLLERNPICLHLINQDPEQLSWFVMGKFLGNVGVVSVLIGLKRFGYRHVQRVALSVAAFQLGLLLYLTFADHQTGVLHFDNLFAEKPELFAKGVKNALVHAGVVSVVCMIGIITRILYRSRHNSNVKLCHT